MRPSAVINRCVLALGAFLFSVAALSFVGCDSDTNQPVSRSSAAARSTLGVPVKGDVPTVCAACLSEEKLGQTVAIEGEIIQQCPSTGCWFRVKDDVGVAFVDLNPAQLNLKEKKVGQHAKVTGRVAKQGGQFRLEAEHVEFASAETDAKPRQQ